MFSTVAAFCNPFLSCFHSGSDARISETDAEHSRLIGPQPIYGSTPGMSVPRPQSVGTRESSLTISEFYSAVDITSSSQDKPLQLTIETNRLILIPFRKGHPIKNSLHFSDFKNLYDNLENLYEIPARTGKATALEEYARLSRLLSPSSSYSPLGGFKILDRSTRDFLGYFEVSEAGEQGEIITIDIAIRKEYQGQEYEKEATIAARHYLRQCSDFKDSNLLKKYKHFGIKTPRVAEATQFMESIGLRRMGILDQKHDLYGVELQEWITDLQITEVIVRTTAVNTYPSNFA